MKIIPVKLYRKIRYRKGHGVHSPFAYYLITGIIEEEAPYYIFDDIEKVRKELLLRKDTVEFRSLKGAVKRKTISEITARESHSAKYGALLFRLVNFLQCKFVLQVGASTGIMSLYLGASRKGADCYVLEDRDCLVPVVREQCKKLGLTNVYVEEGDYMHSLDKVLEKQDIFDLVFINTSRNTGITKQILDKHIKTRVLVLDNIRKNKKMQALWESITSNPHARITLDLYYLGIAFFDSRFYKKHYKAHFDNGKKQNIYKNRRQRFNFFNWRKKNS